MSRFEQTGQGDSPEGGFSLTNFTRGQFNLLPGDRLPEGYYRRLVNGEIRNGYPENRRGTRTMGWMMDTDGTPLAATVQAVKWFRPTRGTINQPPGEVLYIGDNDLWRCLTNNTPLMVEADITSDTQPCEIIPCFNTALILRNLQQVPLIYDPYNTLERGGGVMEQETPAVGSVIPAAETGCYTHGRVWFKVGHDEVGVSDIFEFFYLQANVYKVDSGGNGELVKLLPYGGRAIAAFKTDGVYRIVNTDGDLSDLYVERVHAATGCIAAESVVQVGSDILYLSPNGIERLQITGDNLVVQPAEQFSAPMAPYFKGMVWPAAGESRGVMADNYYLLAVPSKATWRQVDALARRWGEGATFIPQDTGAEPWTPTDSHPFVPSSTLSATRLVVIQPDHKIVIEVGAPADRRVNARLNLDGSFDDTWTSILNVGADFYGPAQTIQSDGKIITGSGSVTLKQLNADGTLNASLGATNGKIWQMVTQSDDKVVAVGAFTTMGGVTRNRIFRLNADGTLDTSFNPNANGTCKRVLLLSGGRMLVCGFFTTIAGASRTGLAILNSDGTIDTSLPTLSLSGGSSNGLYDVCVLSNGDFAFVGDFTSVLGSSRLRSGIVSPTGTLRSFNPISSGTPESITSLTNGGFVFGARILGVTVGGVTRYGWGFNADGSTGFSLDADSTGIAEMGLTSSPTENWFYVVGGFTEINGKSRNTIARVLNDGTVL